MALEIIYEPCPERSDELTSDKLTELSQPAFRPLRGQYRVCWALENSMRVTNGLADMICG